MQQKYFLNKLNVSEYDSYLTSMKKQIHLATPQGFEVLQKIGVFPSFWPNYRGG
jgi:hypothetical protein